ncbi:hypothetical protein E4H04_11665 [Candidatus Bathyarchaeota archaeon]|nr:MAG: hypothetical protein E4H04_11665 [Candidatus Bathyarchaeota archaeon]
MNKLLIQENFILKNNDAKKVHKKTIEWLKQIKANIIQCSPEIIRAIHEKKFHPDNEFIWDHWNPYFWKKELVITLNNYKQNVNIVFSIFRIKETPILNAINKRWWSLLLLDYMEHIDIDNTYLKQNIYNKKTIDMMIKDILFSSFSLMSITLLLIGFFLLIFQGINSFSVIIIFSSLFFLLPMSIWIKKIQKLSIS